MKESGIYGYGQGSPGYGLYYKLKCNKCSKKIFVSVHMIGTIHHSTPAVFCQECLVLDEEFKKTYPDAAEDIEQWLQS